MKNSTPDRKATRTPSKRSVRSTSETVIRDALSSVPVLLWAVDIEGIYTVCEGRISGTTEFSPRKRLGKSFFKIHADQPEFFNSLRCALGGDECVGTMVDGGLLLETFLSPQRDKKGRVTGVVGVARAMTDPSQQDRELARVNRALRLVSECNQVLVRATNESALLQEICNLIVEKGGYRFTWVGYAQWDSDRTVWPMAHAGAEEGYLSLARITWADTARGRGPTGTAIRTGIPVSSRNMEHDPKFKPWREEALKRGYRSSLVLPLTSDGATFGALNIYSPEPDAFDEQEQALLMELAHDLAFGIMALRDRDARLYADSLVRLANERLEQDVQERTAELEEINTELEEANTDLAHEVQARVKTEQALRVSEQRYRLLFSEMSSAFALHEVLCDDEGSPCDYRFLELNSAFTEMTGLNANQVIGKTVREAIPDIEASWIERYGNVALTGEPIQFDQYFPPLDRHYSIVAYSPQPGQFAVIFTDISERKRMETELRFAEERLAIAQAAGNSGSFDYDAKTNVNVWSNALLSLYGFKPEEFAGTYEAWQTCLHPEDREAGVSAVNQALTTGDYNLEFRIIRHDTHDVRWMHGRGKTYFDSDGVAERFIGINVDITESKRAQEEIASLAQFPSENPSPVLRIRSDGHLLYANAAAETILGKEGWVRGVPLPSWLSDQLRLAWTAGPKKEFEYVCRDKHCFSFSCVPVPERGYANLYAHNITERKRMEMALSERSEMLDRLNSDLEEANAQLEEEISDRIRAEEAGRAGRAKLDAALASMTDAVFISDVEGNFLDFNDAFATYHRFKDKDECAKTFAEYPNIIDVFFADGTPAPVDMWAVPRALRGEVAANAEYILRRKDSGETWVGSYSFGPIRDEHGKVIGSVVAGRDVTEHKRTEDAVLHAKLEWERTFDSVPDLIAILDNHHRIKRVNRAMAESLNLTPAQCVGQLCYEAVHGTHCPHEHCPHSLTVKDHQQHVAELHEDHLGGDFLVSTTPLVDDHGEQVGSVHVARDITERKQAEQALRISEERFRLALKNAPVSVATQDLDLRFTWNYNQRTLKPDEDIHGKTDHDIFLPDEAAHLTALKRKVIETGTELRDQIWLLRNGRRMFLDLYLEPLRNSGGTVTGVGVTTVDLTELKMAEEALREARDTLETRVQERTTELRTAIEGVRAERQLFNNLLDELPAYVCLLTPDYHATFANRVFRDRFGEAHGKRCFEFLFDLSQPCEDCETYKVLDTKQPRQWEWTGPDKRNYSVFDFPFTDTDGSSLILEMGIDVTQRKEAEEGIRKLNAELEQRVLARTRELTVVNDYLELEIAERNRTTKALRESEDRLSLALDVSLMGTWELDLATHRTWRSLRHDQIFGYVSPLPEWTFEMFADHVLPEDRSEVVAKFQHAIEHGEDWDFECRIRRADGVTRWIWARGKSSIDDHGQPARMVGLVQDITERKHAEEVMFHHAEHLEREVAERTAQIQKLERLRQESEKQAAIGRMAARIAHEINNPLAGIKNSFLLVKKAIPADFKHYEFVGRIDKEMERIARIVRQMFEIYKPEKSERALMSVPETLKDVAALLEGNARSRGVHLDVDAANLGQPVVLHEDSLRQALFSIVQNAIEASPQGSHVRVSATLDHEALAITVKDEGCGIPEEIGLRIFEPFFTTKSDLVSGGLGLGLSITKGVIETMGGVISYSSESGRGTTFQIILPVSQNVDSH